MIDWEDIMVSFSRLTLFLSIVLLFCGNQASIGGGIRGRVIDALSGIPLSMVEIRTIPISGVAITSADGRYTLQGVKLGRYTVVANKSGYAEHRVTVDVQADYTTADMLLRPKKVETPIVKGIAGFYPHDGSTQDLIAGNPDAFLRGVDWVPDRLGRPNAAPHFNGESSIGLLGNILNRVFSSPVATFTIMGWARTDTYPGYSGGGSLIAKSAGGTYGPYQWSICHDNDGRVKGSVASAKDAGTFVERMSDVIGLGEWFHFALVFDGSLEPNERVQLYVNGNSGGLSRQLGDMGTTTVETPQQITIGATHHAGNPLSPANFYNGSVTEIRIYDRALRQMEIQTLLNPEKR